MYFKKIFQKKYIFNFKKRTENVNVYSHTPENPALTFFAQTSAADTVNALKTAAYATQASKVLTAQNKSAIKTAIKTVNALTANASASLDSSETTVKNSPAPTIVTIMEYAKEQLAFAVATTKVSIVAYKNALKTV